jgi:hypothetical protein
VIIKSYRTPTAYTHQRFRDHVFRGQDNESINLVQGVERDAEDYFDRARQEGRHYAIRHFIISPEAETTRDEMMEVVRDLGKEFGFDPDDAVIVEHQKPRFGEDVFDKHWHVLIADWDRNGDGNVVDTSHNFARQEKIARLAEWKFGHPFVEGAHHDAVVSALKRDGFRQAALALSAAFPAPAEPGNAFTHAEAQRAKRAGANLSKVKSVVRAAWLNTLTVLDLHDALKPHGLLIAVGDKAPPVWVVTNLEGKTLLRVTKAAHATKAEVYNRLGEPNERRNERADGPVREVVEWDRDPEADLARSAGDCVSDSGLAIEPGSGNRTIGARAFLEGLKAYADRIEKFVADVERAAIPKAVRLEMTLSTFEQKAHSDIAAAAAFTLPESKAHSALRGDLERADKNWRAAAAISTTALTEWEARAKLPVPDFFGRKIHLMKVEEAKAKYFALDAAAEKLKAERDAASERLSIRAASDAKTFRLAAAPLEAAATTGRQRLIVAQRIRAIVKRTPKILRYGVLAVCHLGVRVLSEERRKQAWRGDVNMWGIPVEPSEPNTP